MQGLHLTADLYQRQGALSLFVDEHALATFCRTETQRSGLTIVGEKWITFPEYQGEPGGVTGALLLAESHLAIHTWPERKGVTLDIYVCNFSADNSVKAQGLLQRLIDVFAPESIQRNQILRGDEQGNQAGELLWEKLNNNSVYGFWFRKRLLEKHTKYQYLELLESADMGRTLRLDGCLMTAEKEEFFYHEGLVHPAMLSHPNPQKTLIIGGGDGGALEELLKHQPVESATLVDLDGAVIEVSKEYLQSINKGAFDHPKAMIKVGDGAEFVRTTEERFDIVLLDLTDPETPAGPLYTEEFFVACKKVLTSGGAIVLHLGSPFHEPEQVRRLSYMLAGVFTHVSPYGLYIPLYGAYWALAVASDELCPKQVSAQVIDERIQARAIGDLQYYNSEVHGALFALPNYYQKLVPA